MTRKTKSFYTDEALDTRLQAHAEATGESASTIINEALERYLRQFEYDAAFARAEQTGRAARARAGMAAMAAYNATLDETA